MFSLNTLLITLASIAQGSCTASIGGETRVGNLAVCFEGKDPQACAPSHLLMSYPIPRPICKECPIPCIYTQCCTGHKRCSPYRGFDSIIVFFDSIAIPECHTLIFASGREGNGVDEARINAELCKITDCTNFDSLVLIFYAADVAKGVACGDKRFDLHFANWFLNRVYYYLSKKLHHREDTACSIRGGCEAPNDCRFVNCGKEKECDYLCLCSPWDRYTYDIRAATALLNELVTNTVLRPFVQQFIGILLDQLRDCFEKYNGCCKKAGGVDTSYTTFNLFYDLTRLELNALRAVAERNYCIKYTYFFPKLYANFAAVMYVYNRAATGTDPAAVLNRVAYVVTMPPQLNITKVIELS